MSDNPLEISLQAVAPYVIGCGVLILLSVLVCGVGIGWSLP